jgi:hypothetical protein
MTKLSFDSGASAWDRFSVRASALFVPALLAAAEITAGQRVLDCAMVDLRACWVAGSTSGGADVT